MRPGTSSLRTFRFLKRSKPHPGMDGGNSSNGSNTVKESEINNEHADGTNDKRTEDDGAARGVSSPAQGGMKRSRSQVFDPEDTDVAMDQMRLDQPSRRKSSWAFWRSENAAEPSSPVQAAADGPPSPTQPPEEGTVATNDDTVKSVVVDGEEQQLSGRERTYSWSFWSYAAARDNLRTRLESKTKSDVPPMPDVIKSNVSKSNNYTPSPPATTPAGGKPPKPQKKNVPHANRPNLIVPQIEDTLPLLSTHNLLAGGVKRIKKILGYTDTRDTNLFRKEEPTIFKRVLIIGVHGFFPTKMIRPIIGEPTGTSMKFAQVGETAVLSWAKENNLNIEIQKIALEKEGKIFDRVEFFFDILKNSANDIKKADFIFVCSHSQGCPVSVILMSKLLEYGIIDENKKIGILGMAGINIGPFFGMDRSFFVRAYSTIENESLLELFQFQNFESLQSRKYIESLRNLVRHDVKLTFVGSIDDQLVPLYSAIALHVQHPNIFKAVYIDGSTNTPDFVARIIKLSCMLHNIGSTDHDVIKEISNALAGPITGGGHSRIYNDLKVYKLALDFILKTESSNIAIEQPVRYRPFDIKKLGNGANPFNLPWCARGLFFEVSKRLPSGKDEIQLVFREFEEWQPESKALKDVKYRLNGIRAKF